MKANEKDRQRLKELNTVVPSLKGQLVDIENDVLTTGDRQYLHVEESGVRHMFVVRKEKTEAVLTFLASQERVNP